MCDASRRGAAPVGGGASAAIRISLAPSLWWGWRRRLGFCVSGPFTSATNRHLPSMGQGGFGGRKNKERRRWVCPLVRLALIFYWFLPEFAILAAPCSADLPLLRDDGGLRLEAQYSMSRVAAGEGWRWTSDERKKTRELHCICVSCWVFVQTRRSVVPCFP